MEPNKMEKQFKEQLNSREIKPSEMAWDKLDAMLSVADEKPKRNFKWLYIAASIFGFLLVGTIYFNRVVIVKINKETPVVLEQKAKENIDNAVEPEIINKSVLHVQSQKRKVKKLVAAQSNVKKEKQARQLENKEKQILVSNHSKEDIAIANSLENKNDQSVVENKYISAEKLLAEVSDPKFETKTYEEKIRKTRKAISVNPNDLLLNAETELNQSFRESALDRFNKKFNAVKTVLVNRNYEE